MLDWLNYCRSLWWKYLMSSFVVQRDSFLCYQMNRKTWISPRYWGWEGSLSRRKFPSDAANHFLHSKLVYHSEIWKFGYSSFWCFCSLYCIQSSEPIYSPRSPRIVCFLRWFVEGKGTADFYQTRSVEAKSKYQWRIHPREYLWYRWVWMWGLLEVFL